MGWVWQVARFPGVGKFSVERIREARQRAMQAIIRRVIRVNPRA